MAIQLTFELSYQIYNKFLTLIYILEHLIKVFELTLPWSAVP